MVWYGTEKGMDGGTRPGLHNEALRGHAYPNHQEEQYLQDHGYTHLQGQAHTHTHSHTPHTHPISVTPHITSRSLLTASRSHTHSLTCRDDLLLKLVPCLIKSISTALVTRL